MKQPPIDNELCQLLWFSYENVEHVKKINAMYCMVSSWGKHPAVFEIGGNPFSKIVKN